MKSPQPPRKGFVSLGAYEKIISYVVQPSSMLCVKKHAVSSLKRDSRMHYTLTVYRGITQGALFIEGLLLVEVTTSILHSHR